MTRIALLGYGFMGKELERLANEQGCEVVAVFDVDSPLTTQSKTDFDVAIDFTQPDAVLNNVQTMCALGKDLVIGTTGWGSSMLEVGKLQALGGNGIIYGSNFSVGVQVFFRLLRSAGMLVNDIPEYDVQLHEWHHTRKKDSPSGTALSAAAIVNEEISPRVVPVGSTREGDIVGIHTLTIDGPSDTIEITHNAKDRSGFARGALLAARWIHGKQGLYDFTDVFPQVIANT